jgi:hypothetical protein
MCHAPKEMLHTSQAGLELVGPGRNAEETSSAKLGYGGGVPHLSGDRFFKNLDGDHALVSLN